MKLYTTREVAEMMGISQMGVLQAIYRGHLRATRIGRKYFIPDEWLIGLLEKNVVRPLRKKRKSVAERPAAGMSEAA